MTPMSCWKVPGVPPLLSAQDEHSLLCGAEASQPCKAWILTGPCRDNQHLEIVKEDFAKKSDEDVPRRCCAPQALAQEEKGGSRHDPPSQVDGYSPDVSGINVESQLLRTL